MGVRVNRTGGDFEREIPSEGRHFGPVVDVYGPFVKKTQWGDKDTVRVVWAVSDKRTGDLIHGTYKKDGKEVKGWPLTVHQDYAAIISDKSKLGDLLENLTGERPTREEVESEEGVDIEALLMGLPCEFKIVHSDDGKFANIEWVELADDLDFDLEYPEDGRKSETGYTRIQYRDKKPGVDGNAQTGRSDRPEGRREERARGGREEPRRSSRREEEDRPRRASRRDEEEERPRRAARTQQPRGESQRKAPGYEDFDAGNLGDDDDIPF